MGSSSNETKYQEPLFPIKSLWETLKKSNDNKTCFDKSLKVDLKRHKIF